jgi:putative membrane protein insertion efficiency factor
MRRRRLLIGAGLLLMALLFASDLPLKAEIEAIRLYQRFGSPIADHIVTCRYQPTCSCYALQALQTDGFLFGNLKTARRLALCSPIGYLLDPKAESSLP